MTTIPTASETTAPDSQARDSQQANPFTTTEPSLISGILLGVGCSGLFYAGVVGLQWLGSSLEWQGQLLVQRYFLGHPIAIAATTLFWIGVGLLVMRYRYAQQEKALTRRLDDLSLQPEHAEALRHQTNPGEVAKSWMADLWKLPTHLQRTVVVCRLADLLQRQLGRNTIETLPDDQRELAARDADRAHDALGLVRIIVWAIPMLGFLGTVIGITQTLGSLDFSDGAASVEGLKAGLYTAFDTTALGLVLSVVAIFLQFPVERSEQAVLADIDRRVESLLKRFLPSGDTRDKQTELLAGLCEGIEKAVETSIVKQAEVWRQTIDEAHQHWQNLFTLTGKQLGSTLREQLQPALSAHAETFETAQNRTNEVMDQHLQRWNRIMQENAETFSSHHQAVADQTEKMKHSADLQMQEQRELVGSMAKLLEQRISKQDEQFQSRASHFEQQLKILLSESQSVRDMVDSASHMHDFSASQTKLAENIQLLMASNETMHQHQMSHQRTMEQFRAQTPVAEAMKTLAQAVEILSNRLAQEQPQATLRRSA